MKKVISFFTVLLTSLLVFNGILTAGEIKTGNSMTKLTYVSADYYHLSVKSDLSTILFREVNTKEGVFTELFIQGYCHAPTIGDPNLPTCSKLIEVPFNQGFDIEITHAVYQEFNLADYGITTPILPVQPSLSKGVTDPSQVPFIINQATYGHNGYSGLPLVTVNPAGTMRSVNLAQMVISPLQYNPVTNTLRVCTSAEATIRFNGADVEATQAQKQKYNSLYFSRIFDRIGNYTALTDSMISVSPVTYVIVSPPMFKEALQTLVKWKTRKGFRVIEAYTDDPAVGTTTTSIKSYLQNLYTAPAPGFTPPTFILFVGDVAQIPAWMNNGQATDLRYCEYTGDNIPEVYYGRFSASSLTQLQPYIDKTVEYERYAFPDDTFLGEDVMVAGYDGGGNGLTYGNGQINYGTNYYFNTAHNLLSHTYLQPEPAGANYSQQIRDNVSNGVCYANYTAHGSEQGWADPQFEISQIPALQNAHKYCLMVGNCCVTSKYNVNCFAEEITRAANKGAIGYIGASNNSLWDEDYWWGVGFKAVSTTPLYDPQHLGAYDMTFHDHGEPTADWFTTMAEMVVAGNFAVQESNSGNKLYYWEIYNLMGDPSVSIYLSIPPALTATLPSILLIGTNSCTVTAEPWSYVAMSLNDSTLLDARMVDSTGVVTLQYSTLVAPGYAQFVITKQNRKPIIDSVLIIQPTGPYITMGNVTINDLTGGNNDHKADYGETVSLDIVVNNVGAASTTALAATIATSDTNVTILNNTYLFGTVPAGGSYTGQQAFEIAIKNNVTDQHKVHFTLTFTEGSTSWTANYTMTLNAPMLMVGSIFVLDPAPGGNNNGVLDPGESVQLKVAVNNAGHTSVGNATGHIAVDPGSLGFILVSSPNSYIGQIPANGLGFAYFPAVSNGITPAGTSVSLDFTANAGQTSQFNASKELSLVIGQPVQYIIGNTTTSACNGVFLDSGGPNGNYSNYEDLTMTIHAASPGAKLRAIFTEFNVEPQSNCAYDYLSVFNGPSLMDPLIGTYCGNNLPDTITSTSSVGSLTFQFHSDYHNTFPGWSATLKCMGGPMSVIANAFPSAVCEGGSSQLVAIVNGGSGNYTYLWSPATYLDDPTSPTPVATPLADITYTVTISDGTSNITSGAVSLTIVPRPAPPVISQSGSQLISSVATGNQWFINGNLIAGATGQTYTPQASGDYTATVTGPSDVCQSEPSNVFSWLITGQGDIHPALACTIYPNPARDAFTIEFTSRQQEPVTITLTDAFGREVSPRHECQPSGGITVSAAGLTPGIYWCTLQSESNKTVKKIIITR